MSWAIAALLSVVIVFTGVSGGTIAPNTEAVLLVAGFALLVLGLIRFATRRLVLPTRSRWALALLGAFGLLLLVQMLPLPRQVVGIASPGAARLYDEVARVTGKRVRTSLSIDRYETRRDLERFAAYVGAFFAALLLTRRRYFRFVFEAAAACAGWVGLFALIERFVAAEPASRETLLQVLDFAVIASFSYLVALRCPQGQRFFWGLALFMGLGLGHEIVFRLVGPARTQPFGADVAGMMGAFLTRNSFSGWLGLILPLAICLALLSDEWARYMWWGVAAVITLGILLSESRGGIASMVVSLCFMAVALRVHGSRRRIATMVVALGVWVAVVGLCAGLGSTVQRFTVLTDPSRLGFWKAAVQIAADYPLFGTGSGTFKLIYPSYDPGIRPTEVVLNPHNDYLNLIADVGLLGGAILAAVLVLMLGQMLRNVRGSSTTVRLVATACAASAVGVVCHSLVDFNLQLPGIAISFAAIVGLGAAAGNLRRAHDSSSASASEVPEAAPAPGATG